MTIFLYMTSPELVEIQGFALRVIRKRSGLEMEELASLVKCDRSYINRIELGQRQQVSETVYARILKALQIADWRVLMANPHAVREPVRPESEPAEVATVEPAEVPS